MKKLLLVLTITLTLNCCNNDDDQPTNPIDQLPPATQTGENTFGCLLDGEAFIPSGGTNPLDCVYQFVNGEYYFGLQGNKRDQDNHLITISLSTNALEINESNYILRNNEFGNAYAGYLYATLPSFTSLNYGGELTITKLDTENYIVSGTFWFNIEDQNGTVHEIREGRFDMHYSG
ncbi:hypothetical protein [Winogradskyella rapida]|uniref:Lipoprotein n=1 Tax=Winogradskyella rapida TaxID=549701 RepID=A0ABW3KPU5_9FLAO